MGLQCPSVTVTVKGFTLLKYHTESVQLILQLYVCKFIFISVPCFCRALYDRQRHSSRSHDLNHPMERNDRCIRPAHGEILKLNHLCLISTAFKPHVQVTDGVAHVHQTASTRPIMTKTRRHCQKNRGCVKQNRK